MSTFFLPESCKPFIYIHKIRLLHKVCGFGSGVVLKIWTTLKILIALVLYLAVLLMLMKEYLWKDKREGSLGGAAVWCLPLARGAILETRDRIPRQTPGVWSLLLLLPVSLPLSLSVCDYHK